MNNLGRATGREILANTLQKEAETDLLGGLEWIVVVGLDVAAEAARRYTITSDSCGVVAGSERSARRGGGGLVVPVIE